MSDGRYDRLLPLVAKLLRSQATLMQVIAATNQEACGEIFNDSRLRAFDGTAKEVIDELRNLGIEDFWTA